MPLLIALKVVFCENYILHRDPVKFVDRGFDIADEVAFAGAALAIPSFSKACDKCSRHLSHVRIHVERLNQPCLSFYLALRYNSDCVYCGHYCNNLK